MHCFGGLHMRLACTGASRPSPLNRATATQRRREATMLRIFVGHDPLQPVSTTVLVHSIISRASKPVCVTPLSLKTLPIKRRALTEFTYSRFLVPYLCDYQGWSLFLDTDMLVLEDIAKLFELADDRHTDPAGQKQAEAGLDTIQQRQVQRIKAGSNRQHVARPVRIVVGELGRRAA